ncbi:hypothetical protein [Salmonella enterica]|uniref:hypothetical protein n=1 Tax=Salmonella enterica TaxID=28901 RepID=UPI0021D49827|nr:hypothetical protein [Salmonella enterica]MCU7097893.1 hypothetical protein [Salmonella enterica]MCU7116298.1 hypothetical protein [Salmonella enterica]MCU7123669.1 hypothetical protein [Salmonella enterica]
MIRTLVVDYTHARQEPNYSFIDGQFHVADCVYPASAIDWWMPVPDAPDDEDC